MKGISITFLTLMFGTFAFAQIGNFEWVYGQGSSEDFEEGLSISVAEDGSIYVAGTFREETDFDPGPGELMITNNGARDAFVQKISPDKELIWVKTFGGTGSEYANSVTTDPDGNVLVLGRFSDTVDFDPGPDEYKLEADVDYYSWTDIFVLKLTSDGDFIWAKSFGSSHYDWPETILTDSEGDIYSSGTFYGTIDFDPGPDASLATSAGDFDGFIHKLDSEGNFEWAHAYGGSNREHFEDMHIDLEDNVFVVGNFHGEVDFNAGGGEYILDSSEDGKCVVIKLNSAGGFIWAEATGVGGSGSNRFTGITTNSAGEILLTGEYSGIVDFDPGPGEYLLDSDGYPNHDIFITKWSAGANLVWATSIGSGGNDFSTDLETDGENLYISGAYYGTVDFDPGPGEFDLTNPPWEDEPNLFILKLDGDGNFGWAQGIGDYGTEIAYCLDLDAGSNVYATGFFTGSPDFDASEDTVEVFSNGSKDIFVLKLNQCNEMAVDEITACDDYTWINGVTYTESNYTAKDTLTNIYGCDSIVQLNLTITDIDTAVTKTGVYLISNQPEASYQWLDCNNDMLPLADATDELFVATDSGNYAVEITIGECVDTSMCYHISEEDVADYSFYFTDLGSFPAYCRLYNYQNGNGGVHAGAAGGMPDYSYLWTDLTTGETSVNSTWGGRNPGLYKICVTDSYGASICDTVSVDSLTPIASFEVISDDLSPIEWGYIGDAPVTVSFENTSQYFANPYNPSADTTFHFRPQGFEDWQIYSGYPELDDYTFIYGGVFTSTLVARNKNGCTDTAHATIGLFGPLSVDESKTSNLFSIVSEHGKGQLSITKTGTPEGPVELKVYNLSGQLILSQQLFNQQEQITFNAARGVYLFEFYSAESNQILGSGKFHY